jgi:hypothetical protein
MARSQPALYLNWHAQRLHVHDERLQFLFCQLTRERRHDVREPHSHCGRRIQNRLAYVRFVHDRDSAPRILNRPAEQTVQRWADTTLVGFVTTDTPTLPKQRPSGSQCPRRLATDDRDVRSVRRGDARFPGDWLTPCPALPSTRQRIAGFSGSRDEDGDIARIEHEGGDDHAPSPHRGSAKAGGVLPQDAIRIEEDKCLEKNQQRDEECKLEPEKDMSPAEACDGRRC